MSRIEWRRVRVEFDANAGRIKVRLFNAVCCKINNDLIRRFLSLIDMFLKVSIEIFVETEKFDDDSRWNSRIVDNYSKIFRLIRSVELLRPETDFRSLVEEEEGATVSHHMREMISESMCRPVQVWNRCNSSNVSFVESIVVFQQSIENALVGEKSTFAETNPEVSDIFEERCWTLWCSNIKNADVNSRMRTEMITDLEIVNIFRLF